MRLRRIFCVLVTFTMAHLAVVGSDLVCAKHSVTQVAQADVAMPGMDHGQTGHHGDQPPCKTPARADCCQAVASCAVSVAIASVVAVADAPPMSSAVLASIDNVPLSRVAAPDPPPPKA